MSFRICWISATSARGALNATFPASPAKPARMGSFVSTNSAEPKKNSLSRRMGPPRRAPSV